ncbi:MAG: DNA polymerase III subunit gamma/tau [Lachnospiraceae bacterium]|nr:DNA polymerase III subunit gamma/tau [Lachnospiraceae bacterium]
MSYTALYRKWRPRVFEDVKGQDAITATLKNQILAKRIGHAYLFCGTRGTGKTTVAKIFARAVNCENPAEGSPCGECESCRRILEGASLNVIEIDAASNNGVENIREIREQVQYPPAEGRYRVYIIDEVHMLSTGAFNALLKTLEEPPAYVIFILATTEAHKIPVTVLSRCQRYDFKRITMEIIAARLKELTEAEEMPVEERALRYVAKAGDGSMRDALSLLDQCAAFHYGETLTYEHVLDILGAVDTGVFRELFAAVSEKRTTDCIRKLEELIAQGRELSLLVIDFVWYLRNLLLIKTADDAERILDMSEENLKLLREDAGMADETTLMREIRVLSELSGQLRFASQKRVLVEVAFIKLTRPQMEENLDSVLIRLAELEKKMGEGIPSGFTACGLPHTSPMPAVAEETEHSQTEPHTIVLPRAQLEDLEQIRGEWGKLVREMGMSIRPCFRETVVEPAGEGCLCVVFSNKMNFEMGSRPSVIGDLERHVEERLGKTLYFKTRLQESGERMDTRYISDEELRETIHMEIEVER